MKSGSDRPPAPELPRVLGRSQATAIVVGTIIGSGIFLVPHEMIRATGSEPLVLLAWVLGGLLSFAGALTYAELGAMMPRAGGEYVFLRKCYGDLVAFLYMWTWFALAKPASIASLATGLVRTLRFFSGFSWMDAVLLPYPIQIRWSQLLAISGVWLVTGLNYVGMRWAGAFQLIFTWLKVGLILAIAGYCFFGSRSAGAAPYPLFFSAMPGGLSGFMIALIAALWAYDGWNDLTMVAGEVRDPQRNLPIGLLAGVGIVALLYILTSAAIDHVLPAALIAASERPAVDALSVVAGRRGVALVTTGIALSILVALNGTTMSGGRIPFAAARDGLFFSRMAHIHPRFATPSTSLIVQAWLSTVLLLLVGRFQQLFELAIFSEWLFYMLTTSTIFFYRRRGFPLDRPFRAWGYPVLPLLFVCSAGVVLCYSVIGNLRNSLMGSAVILAGVPLFYGLRRRRGPRTNI